MQHSLAKYGEADLAEMPIQRRIALLRRESVRWPLPNRICEAGTLIAYTTSAFRFALGRVRPMSCPLLLEYLIAPSRPLLVSSPSALD